MTPEVTDITEKKHFFLVAGNVVYKLQDETKEVNPMGIITLNGVITADSQVLGVNAMSQAQQVLQHHFRLKTEDNTLEIADVIILNIIYLGFQSKEEFNNLNLGSTQ